MKLGGCRQCKLSNHSEEQQSQIWLSALRFSRQNTTFAQTSADSLKVLQILNQSDVACYGGRVGWNVDNVGDKDNSWKISCRVICGLPVESRECSFS